MLIVTVDIANMESTKLSLLFFVASRNQRGGLLPGALEKAGAKQLTHMTAILRLAVIIGCDSAHDVQTLVAAFESVELLVADLLAPIRAGDEPQI
jgi:hypothetical protein